MCVVRMMKLYLLVNVKNQAIQSRVPLPDHSGTPLDLPSYILPRGLTTGEVKTLVLTIRSELLVVLNSLLHHCHQVVPV